MRYRVLLPTPKGLSRLTETVGINGKQMVFNKVIQRKMKISCAGEAYLGLAVNEDGFLCLTVLKENAARTAFRLTSPKSASGSRMCSPGKNILGRLPKGRFAITGQDGGWFVTDCPYDDSGEERCAAQETEAPEEKHRGRPARGAMRTPPDGWPGGGGLDAYENDKRVDNG